MAAFILPRTTNCVPLSGSPNPPTPISTGNPPGWYPTPGAAPAVFDGDSYNSLCASIIEVLVAGGQPNENGDLLTAIQALIAGVTGGTAYLPLSGGTLSGELLINGSNQLVVGGNITAGGVLTVNGGVSNGSFFIPSGSLQIGTGTNIADGDFANSLTTNGYQKFPGGFIMQWGYAHSGPQGSPATITFPIAFPNACVAVFGTATDNTSQNHIDAYAPSSTNFKLTNSGPTPGATDYAQWTAYGF